MNDIDSLIAEAQNHPDAQIQGGDDIDALLQEAQNHPDAVQEQPRPIGVVRAAQDIVQTPGKMIDAAKQAYQNAIPDPIVRDKNGKVIPRSFFERLLDTGSGAVNTIAAPFFTGANQGIKTISDAFSNPYNGQGLLEPLSNQNIANMAQGSGIPIDKLQQIPQGVKNIIGERAYQDLSEGVNIGTNFFPGVAGLKGAVTGTGVAMRGAGDVLTNVGKTAYVQELGLLKPLAKRIAPNLNLAKQKVGETIKNYGIDSPAGFNSASEKADALFDQKWKQADDLIDDYSQKNPDKTTSLDDLTNAAKKEIPDNIRAGERNQASGVLDNIKGDLVTELEDKGIDPSKLTPSQIVDVKRSIGAKYKNFDRSAEPVKEAMYDNFESAVIKKINSFVPEAGKLNLEARDIRFAKDAIDEAAGRNNKLSGWMALGVEAGAAVPSAISHPDIALPIIAGATAVDLARRGILSGRGASTLMNLGRGVKGLGESLVGPKEGPVLPDRVGWNQSGEGPTIANMTQQQNPASPPGQSSYPTIGTLSQEGDPFYQSLMTPKDFKKAQKEAKNAKQFNSQAQSINAQDYPDYNPNQLKTPDEHFMDQDYMQGFNPEQVSDVANKWKMDFKRETFPGRFEDVNYSKLKPEEQKKVRQIAKRANIDSDYRRELVENQIITSDQNVHPNDVIGWANEGGHVKGGKKGGPTIGNMFNSNLGSGVNIGMPMATRAGLGGAYGYIASGPDATPQERLRNALMGAAGGAFVPTLGKMIAGKGNGAPGVLMAPPGVPPMAQYMDEAVAQQAGKLGLNYRGSLNKTTQFPALAKEQHYMNDDLGTKSSFVVHEGGDVAKELDAHRRRFWGDKYEQKMKSLNLKLTKSK